ncbi:MAG: TIGR04282 family arsenosugar biosynthesis glycosyltransferase [Flavobacteriales bacterium]|nr:TIGR04282 family arsenosugar biosynthesis glycosyltransferase [Flavobacteriales bacterium]
MKDEKLIIFIKNPVAGKVKTRIAKSLGNEKALEIYLHLLELTRNVVLETDCEKYLFYSDAIEGDAWDENDFKKHLQQGGDLGDRMENAFDRLFSNKGEKVLVIGSDCPELTSEIIERAFQLLDQKDVVIGPAKDGGYYLLGMKKPSPFLFDDKEWSTDSVFEDTVVDLMENRLSYGLLPTLSDVDNIYDLHLLPDKFGP